MSTYRKKPERLEGLAQTTLLDALGSRWLVKVTTGPDAVEFISHERALRLADELEAGGWHESAGQVRQAAETAMRFQSYAQP